jgi:hypothetical protein
MTLAPPSGSPVDIERGRDSQDPARPSKTMALLDALEAGNFTTTIRHAASHPKPLRTPCEGLMGEIVDVACPPPAISKGLWIK